jgi:hypothetical protein
VILGLGQIPTTPEVKEELKRIFNKDYKAEEINQALAQVLELRNQVRMEIIEETDDIVMLPDDFIEGS